MRFFLIAGVILGLSFYSKDAQCAPVKYNFDGSAIPFEVELTQARMIVRATKGLPFFSFWGNENRCGAWTANEGSGGSYYKTEVSSIGVVTPLGHNVFQVLIDTAVPEGKCAFEISQIQIEMIYKGLDKSVESTIITGGLEVQDGASPSTAHNFIRSAEFNGRLQLSVFQEGAVPQMVGGEEITYPGMGPVTSAGGTIVVSFQDKSQR